MKNLHFKILTLPLFFIAVSAWAGSFSFPPAPDSEAPVISNMPGNIEVFAEQGQAYAFVNWAEPTATDNVGVTSFSSDPVSGSAFSVGITTVTYTAIDLAGNVSTASFSITVNKNTPIITWPAPGSITYGITLGATQLNASSSVAGSFSYDPPSGTLLNAGNAQTLSVSFTPDLPAAYNGTSASTTLNVSKATLSVTADNKSINEGEAIPGLSLTYSGFVNGEDQTVLNTEPGLSTTATVDGLPGEYVINITGGSDNNYDLSRIPGTLTILDITPPVISGIPADINVFANAGESFATITWVAPTATDNVEVTSLISTYAPGSNFPVGTTTVSYTASDTAGNQAIASFNITVNMNSPDISWGEPEAISYGTALGEVQYNITAPVPGTINYDPSAGSMLNAGKNQPLFADFIPDNPAAFNNVSLSTTIDVNKAVLTVTANNLSINPGDEIPELSFSYSGFVNNEGPGVINSAPTLSTTATAESLAGDYVISIMGGSDNNYELNTLPGTLTILDNTNPVISDMPANITVFADMGQAYATVSWTEPSATDDVELSSLIFDHPSGSSFPVGTSTVNYTARDVTGNQASASFTITVNKNDPVFTWNTPESITYGSPLGATQLNASSNAAGSYSYDPPAGTLLDAGDAQALNLSFTPDNPAAYNSASASTTINIDRVVLTVTADDKTINEGDAIPVLSMSYSGFVNGDNSTALNAEPRLSTTATAESTPGDYVINITGGNDYNYSLTKHPGTLSIVDITGPVISGMPANITVLADEGEAYATVTWLAPTATDEANIQSFVSNYSPGSTFPVGSTTVTYTATNETGNQTSASFSIAVSKNRPVVTWNAPEAIPYGTTLGATQLSASSTVAGTFTYDPPAGILPDAGSGQALQVSFVPDQPAAYSSVTASTSLSVNKIPLSVTIMDASMNQGDPVPELSFSYSGFVNGEDAGVLDTEPTLVTTATSESLPGNYDISLNGESDKNYTFIIDRGTLTILDITSPLISHMPENITLFADEGEAYATVVWTAPIATDNVGVSSFTSNYSQGSTFATGINTVYYIATDAIGNQASASFTITVNKNDPVITWSSAGEISYGTALGAAQLSANSTAAGTFSYDPPAGSLLNVGEAQILSVSFVPDQPAAYNSLSASTTIDVSKTELTVTADNKQMNEGDTLPELTLSYSGFVNGEDVGVLDTEPSLSTTATRESLPGNYAISLDGGSDHNYALSLKSGTLSIVDNTPPLISNMPGDITVFADEGRAYATVSWAHPTATDKVGVYSLSPDHSPGSAFPVGSTTVSYTAADAAGNQALASFDITVNKNTPVISWATPGAIQYGSRLGNEQLNASSAVAGSYLYDPPAGTLPDAGVAQTLNVSFEPAKSEAYTPVTITTTIDVSRAELSVTAENKSIREGDPVPELTLIYSGFVNNEDQDVIDTPPTLTTTTTNASEPGEYAISITGGSDNNYTLSLQGGTLTILPPVHISRENQIKCTVYPNPANEGIRINGVDGTATLTLYSINGSMLIKRKIEDKTYIPLTGLNPGLYLVDIQSQMGNYRTKIVKNR